MASIGSTAIAHKGRTTGFDYLRLGLSLAVVTVHCLSFSNVAWKQWMADHGAITSFILPAFFALSGYLVTGSLFRNSIPAFITLRVVRLVPALAFEITLSAIVLGSYFTRLPLGEYYTSPMFGAYFLNIVGDIHFYLPGVFGGDLVNLQLWTIPYELKCYAVLVGVSLINLFPIRQLFPLALLIFTVALTAWLCLHYAVGVNVPGQPIRLQGRSLVCAFLWACVLYLFRDRIWYSAPLAIGSVAVAGLILINPHHAQIESIATLPIAYVTVYIGLMALPPIKFGDLSYGIFLFHFPILQTLRLGLNIYNPWGLLASTALISGICALVSWNLIERPILARKDGIIQPVDRVIDRLVQIVHHKPTPEVPATVNNPAIVNDLRPFADHNAGGMES